jgi:hypothetical protein
MKVEDVAASSTANFFKLFKILRDKPPAQDHEAIAA